MTDRGRRVVLSVGHGTAASPQPTLAQELWEQTKLQRCQRRLLLLSHSWLQTNQRRQNLVGGTRYDKEMRYWRMN